MEFVKVKYCNSIFYVNKYGDKVLDKNKKELNIRTNKDGYLVVTDKNRGSVLVHRLVAIGFVENKEGKKEVHHKDFNRKNPSWDNLIWVTHKENICFSTLEGNYKIRNINEKNNPNYGNSKLSIIYSKDKELSKLKQGRSYEKNGKAKKVELYKDDIYINTFLCIKSMYDFMVNNYKITSKYSTFLVSVRKSIELNRKYLKHYTFNKLK